MRRTFSARFMAVGNVDERDGIVDKRRTWGRVYTSRVAAELAGLPGTVECEACDMLLALEPGKAASSIVRRHEKTLRHRRIAGLA